MICGICDNSSQCTDVMKKYPLKRQIRKKRFTPSQQVSATVLKIVGRFSPSNS
jgi:hypothetical protein